MRIKFLRYRSWYQIDFQASGEPCLGLALVLPNYHAMYLRHVSHVNLVSSNDGLAHHRVSVARWLSFGNFVTIWNSNFHNKRSTCVSVCVVFLFFGCYRETCCDTVSRVYCVCVLRQGKGKGPHNVLVCPWLCNVKYVAFNRCVKFVEAVHSIRFVPELDTFLFTWKHRQPKLYRWDDHLA